MSLSQGWPIIERVPLCSFALHGLPSLRTSKLRVGENSDIPYVTVTTANEALTERQAKSTRFTSLESSCRTRYIS